MTELQKVIEQLCKAEEFLAKADASLPGIAAEGPEYNSLGEFTMASFDAGVLYGSLASTRDNLQNTLDKFHVYLEKGC